MIIIKKAKRLRKIVKKALKKINIGIVVKLKSKLGIPVRFKSPAREVLENAIISFFASQNIASRVLFVGCDWYTKHYEKLFKCEYWTIDPNPKQRRYGASNHIVDYLENLHQHIDEEYFDLIICNGVLGFGLDQKDLAERAFDSCFRCLRNEGLLIIGLDDSPGFLSFKIDGLQSLHKFSKYEFPPFSTSNYSLKPKFDYVFNFFKKPSNKCMRTRNFISLQ